MRTAWVACVLVLSSACTATPDYATMRAEAQRLSRPPTSDRAFTLLAELMARNPADVDLYVWRSRLLWMRRRFAEAADDMTRAMALEPDNLNHLYRRAELREEFDMDGALADWTAAIERHREQGPYSSRASLLMKLGRWSEAIDDWTREIERNQDPRAFFDRAWCRVAAGDPLGALRDYDRAEPRKWQDSRFELQWAFAELQAGQTDQARIHFQGAFTHVPDDAAEWLGLFELGEGNYDEALRCFLSTKLSQMDGAIELLEWAAKRLGGLVKEREVVTFARTKPCKEVADLAGLLTSPPTIESWRTTVAGAKTLPERETLALASLLLIARALPDDPARAKEIGTIAEGLDARWSPAREAAIRLARRLK